MGTDWPTCPLRAVADDWRLAVVLGLVRAQRLAPVADWPEGWLAWVMPIWGTVATALDERAAQEARRG